MATSNLKRNLNQLLKQTIALMIIISFVIPQNLFANNPGSNGADGTSNALSEARLDFSNALTSQESKEIGIEPGSIQALHSTGTLNGMKVDLDLIRGEFSAADASKLVKVLKEFEPEIRQAYEADPTTKFTFTNIADETEKNFQIEALEILDLLNDVKKTSVEDVKIKLPVAQRLRGAFSHMFGDVTQSNIYWGLTRTVINGTSAYISFYYGSNIPLPAAISLAAIVGVGSGTISVFINKYAAWLEDNSVNPSKGIRNKLSSIETLMFLSPFLIALQHTGLTTLEGAALLGGVAAATTLIQSVYHQVKKRSPQSAMWYKWYATEALFLTVPNLAAPVWDIFTENIRKTIGATFFTSLISTMSQGVWDVLITSKFRRPQLDAAIKKDIAELSHRLNGRNVFDLPLKDLKKLVRKDSIKVKNKFQKNYFAVSIVSVMGAIATNAGVYTGVDALTYTGIGILTLLGGSGVVKWYKVLKNEKAQKPTAFIGSQDVNSVPRIFEPVMACSSLFAM